MQMGVEGRITSLQLASGIKGALREQEGSCRRATSTSVHLQTIADVQTIAHTAGINLFAMPTAHMRMQPHHTQRSAHAVQIGTSAGGPCQGHACTRAVASGALCALHSSPDSTCSTSRVLAA